MLFGIDNKEEDVQGKFGSSESSSSSSSRCKDIGNICVVCEKNCGIDVMCKTCFTIIYEEEQQQQQHGGGGSCKLGGRHHSVQCRPSVTNSEQQQLDSSSSKLVFYIANTNNEDDLINYNTVVLQKDLNAFPPNTKFGKCILDITTNKLTLYYNSVNDKGKVIQIKLKIN